MTRLDSKAIDAAYLQAGNEFRVGTQRWWGDAVVGRDAIYLLQSAPARGRKVFAPFEQVADRLLPSRSLAAGPVNQIPESVRTDPHWPVRASGHRAALVIPRNEVAFLYHERGKLETRLVFRDVEVAIPHGRFGGGRVREFAEAAGWPMFWDGRAINLPDRSPRQLREQVRTLRFGRPTLSYSVITIGFILGASPIALQFARGLNADLVSTLWLTAWIAAAVLLLFGWVALRRGL